MLSIAANRDWEVHQMDVNSAYLNASLSEEIYMHPQTEMGLSKAKFLMLKKALYELKQSGREWHRELSSGLKI